jgi:Phage minor capsid protein 2
VASSGPQPAAGRPSNGLTSGEIRELRAIAAAVAVATAFTAAEMILLGLLANAVTRVITGARLRALAYAELRQAMAVAIAATEARARVILQEISRSIRSDVHQAILNDLPGGLGTRAAASAMGAHPPAAWRNLPSLLHQAGLNAAREIDDEFRTVVEEVMRFRSGVGEAVRDLQGKERKRLSLSRLKAAQVILDEFAVRGITVFRDRAGREWDLAAYAEMATRTASSRMHLLLYLQAMGPAGFGLVLVYPLTTLPPCGHCAPYVGRILSLNGSSIGEQVSVTDADGTLRTERVVSSLEDAVANGLLHPNCRHSLMPFTNGAYIPPADSWPVPPERNYKAEQEQRALERALRDAKRLWEVAVTPAARAEALRRITKLEREIAKLAARYHLPRLPARESAGRAR